ncbi:hypothetical protein D8B29_05635 [Verminephrobacter eiseniae]|nr:hypothetical protein [Verminephrobacter eiseniae]MCW8190303.1 hypothetical protein [Verminephrobacter eiseniae]
MGLAAFPEEVPKDSLAHLVGLPHPGAPTDTMKSLVSRHGSDVVGCAQPSERSARRIAQPIPSVLASDATPRCASMASADRQMIGDATPALALRCFSWRTRGHRHAVADTASVRRRSGRRAGQREFCRIEGELDLEPHGVPQEDLVQRNARHLRLLPVDALCLEVLACALQSMSAQRDMIEFPRGQEIRCRRLTAGRISNQVHERLIASVQPVPGKRKRGSGTRAQLQNARVEVQQNGEHVLGDPQSEMVDLSDSHVSMLSE